MSTIQKFTFNPFQENTYIIYDQTKEAIIIDPGCHIKEEENQLKTFIENNNLKVVKLINTHCHIDHILGNAFVKNTFQVKLYIHKEDEATLRSAETYAPVYGFPQFNTSEADEYMEEGDEIKFGNTSFKIIFTPGHAPGHICLINEDEKYVINGDVLFRGSIGRTDLPGGDYDTLIKSIKDKLFTLDDDYTVYTGHGPETSIGLEKVSNPFVGQKA